MKLKTFNTTNIQAFGKANTKPYLQINSGTGLISINKQASDLIGIKDGSQVQFHQSEETPSDWFIEVVKDAGFIVRTKDSYEDRCVFNSTKLARLIFDSVEFTGKGGRVYLGEEVKNGKQKLFTLITASLVNE